MASAQAGDDADLDIATKHSRNPSGTEQYTTQDSVQDSPNDSPQLSPTTADHEDDSTRQDVPLQKRRRVTRACDECRRKKIKCDGKQPCTHCTVYSYECTYDQPSNRRRNAPPQYVESLETRLKRANAIIEMLIPNVDLDDPDLETKLRQLTFSPSPLQSKPPGIHSTLPFVEEQESGSDDRLESMVKATGMIDLDEQGHFEYHGHSSGLHFVRRMRESLGDLMGPEVKSTPFIKSRPMSQVFDSPRSFSDSLVEFPPGSDLPSREVAREMCDITINDAGALLRFVHYPTFVGQMENLYDVAPEQYGNEEHMFLPLLYSVLAVATLFGKTDGPGAENSYESAITEGFKYFKQSRQLMDIADCRDLRQLQAILFMVVFLQSSAKLSVCYAYIGVALRSALRMGLHRTFTDSFSSIEAETRKRVFWIIRKMDTYVGALLGLPHSLDDDEIDQEFPAEVDDEYITEHGIMPMPEGQISLMAASNAHTRLVYILEKIVKYIYPAKASVKSPVTGKSVNTYSVSYAKIVEIERDLQEWQDCLPMRLKPGGEADWVMQRCQQLLRMMYAHAQMMLYRPFLHYVSQTKNSAKVDKRSYACAAACVSVSRNIIHITIEMKRSGLLVGSYWFSMYTTFFAILSLVFYAWENPESEASRDVMKVAREAKETLESLAQRSMAADRCASTLKSLFQQLPDHVFTRKPSIGRKRRPSPSPTPNPKEVKVESQPLTPITPSMTTNYQVQQVKATNPQNFDLNSLQYASAHGFYEGEHSLPATQSQSPQIPQYQQANLGSDAFVNSPTVAENSRLADLSAVMFPNPDPFAYPNQPTDNNVDYEAFFKNMNNNIPFNAYPENMQTMPLRPENGPEGISTVYIPPSSTFNMFPSDSPTTTQEADVPLLGPMPMYMMQGDSFANTNGIHRPPANGAHPSPPHTQTPDSPSSKQPSQQQPSNKYIPTGGPPNMNLDALLGNEEWVGQPTDRMGSFISPSVASRDGPFTRKGAPNQRQQAQFQNLNPGQLGWGLEGF